VDVDGGDGDIFGVTAVDGAAHELGIGAEVVVAGQAVRADAAGDAGVNDHALALFDRGHAASDLHDLAGAVAAEDVKRGELALLASNTCADVGIEAVDAGGADSDFYLMGLEGRLGAFAVHEDFRAAVAFDINGLHTGSVLRLGVAVVTEEDYRQGFAVADEVAAGLAVFFQPGLMKSPSAILAGGLRIVAQGFTTNDTALLLERRKGLLRKPATGVLASLRHL
jgi:hypothetical protein